MLTQRATNRSRDQLADDLVRVGAGDIAAFVRVHQATSAKLFGIIVRILGNRGVAEEVLQEVYLRVWHRATDFDRAQASPITWLATIARNRALDEKRRKQPGRLDDVPDLLEMPSDEDVLADYLAAEDRRRLATCLERLGSREREVLTVIYYEGLSRVEAAARFGETVSTIRSLIGRGLAELKSCLQHG